MSLGVISVAIHCMLSVKNVGSLCFFAHVDVFTPCVRMAELSKALRSGRSLVLQARVRITLLTTFVNRKPTVSH